MLGGVQPLPTDTGNTEAVNQFYPLQVMLPAPSQVYPLMEPGTTPQDMVWRETFPGSGVRVYARERFDYQARCLCGGGLSRRLLVLGPGNGRRDKLPWAGRSPGHHSHITSNVVLKRY